MRYFFFGAVALLPLLSVLAVLDLVAGFALLVLVVCFEDVLVALLVWAVAPNEIAAVINNALRSLIAFIFYFLGY